MNANLIQSLEIAGIPADVNAIIFSFFTEAEDIDRLAGVCRAWERCFRAAPQSVEVVQRSDSVRTAALGTTGERNHVVSLRCLKSRVLFFVGGIVEAEFGVGDRKFGGVCFKAYNAMGTYSTVDVRGVLRTLAITPGMLTRLIEEMTK